MIVKNDFFIVCGFGMRTLSYVNGGKPHLHTGIDIRAPFGTEIIAPEAVKIKRFGVGKYGEGFLVADGLDSGKELKFIHVKVKVLAGIITKGDVLAISDGSGTTDGKGGKAPHLHFETWDGESWANGKPVDPVVSGYCDKYLRV